MNLEKVGTSLKKNTKTKVWWLKLFIGLILSNIFFFILFSHPEKTIETSRIPEGWVEVQLDAQLLTPFHLGKKVLLVHRNGRKKLEGVLQASAPEQIGKITVLVKESEAHALFMHEAWEILPYLKHLTFSPKRTEASHEIRY